ncbi:MAG: CoA transferase [Chloroflexi bacterium]|nr:CoA transferase [Chloroflexota bacterium]
MPLPLEGLRVCDLTQFWAGPFATQYLAHLGAEVIKVEPAGRGDSVRSQGSGHENFWEWAPIFNGTNVNKHGCTLDIATKEGKDLLTRLISASDVVAENYSARVVKNLNLGYDYVRKVNPTAILLSMPGFGRGGPWEQYVGFGPQFEQASGITYASGYPDTEPIGNAAMSDPIGGMYAAIAIMIAIEHRKRTGEGQFIDFSTTEGIAFLNAYTLLDYTMNGRVRERNANKHVAWAPHGAYPCKASDRLGGNDEWVAITVQDDAQFAALCEAMGKPGLAQDERFADVLNRWEHEDALREQIAAWTRQHDSREVMRILQAKGVPAGATINHATVANDPQVKERDFLWYIDRPVNGGKHPYYGFPAKLSKSQVRARKATPTVGQDNEYVYGDVLNLSKRQIEDLNRRGVIARTVRV